MMHLSLSDGDVSDVADSIETIRYGREANPEWGKFTSFLLGSMYISPFLVASKLRALKALISFVWLFVNSAHHIYISSSILNMI